MCTCFYPYMPSDGALDEWGWMSFDGDWAKADLSAQSFYILDDLFSKDVMWWERVWNLHIKSQVRVRKCIFYMSLEPLEF